MEIDFSKADPENRERAEAVYNLLKDYEVRSAGTHTHTHTHTHSARRVTIPSAAG